LLDHDEDEKPKKIVAGAPGNYNALQQTVLLQLLAQRIAVDAEVLGGQRLIAAGQLEHHLEQGFFHA
jgi:hypothetical protein